MKSSPGVFVREATGLVREVGTWSSLASVFVLVTSAVPILWVSTMYTAPGANWPLAFVIAFVPTLFMAGLYSIIGASMPRSGGDYVFASRAFSSVVGFVNSWGITIAYLLVLGIEAFLNSTYIGYLLAGLGAYYNNSALSNLGVYVTQTGPSFVLAMGLIAFSSLVAVTRPRHAWRFVFIAGFFTIIASFFTEVVLAGINPGSFATAFNSFMGNSTAYSSVITTGGVVPLQGWAATAAALPFAWLSWTFYNLPTSWAGEVKNVKRTMPLTIIVGLLLVLAYYLSFSYIVTHAFGQPFLENWSALAASGSSPIAGVGNFVPFFSLLVYGNTPFSLVMYFLMFLAFWLQNLVSFPPLVISQTRYIFAWSFDKVIPERFASVSGRFHTPVLTTALVAAGGFIGAALIAFLPSDASANYVAVDFAMFTFIFIIPAIAGIVFPYTRKDIYQTSFVAKRKFGLPLIVWLGIGSAVYLVISTYLSFSTGSLPITTFTALMLVAIYAAGVLVYLRGYITNKRKGIPLSMVFREIPPE